MKIIEVFTRSVRSTFGFWVCVGASATFALAAIWFVNSMGGLVQSIHAALGDNLVLSFAVAFVSVAFAATLFRGLIDAAVAWFRSRK